MLRLVKRGKKGIWQIVGTVGGERYRESTGTDSVPHAQAKLAQRQAGILDRVTFGEKRTTIFAEAVILYIEGGGEARFTDKLTDYFGAHRMNEITQSMVMRFAAATYPKAGPQGINRQVFTPLIAIFRAAHEAGMCELPSFKRPKQPKRKAVRFARDEDIARLLPCCSNRLSAAVLLLAFTGARASEACRLADEHIDWHLRTVTLLETKNGTPRVVALAGVAFAALLALRGTCGPIFGFASRFSLNQALARACRRAGLPIMTSHKIGRHGFAARLLRQGKTLAEVKDAGGWKTMRVVAETYGHLERSQIDAAVRDADATLAQLITPTEANVVQLIRERTDQRAREAHIGHKRPDQPAKTA